MKLLSTICLWWRIIRPHTLFAAAAPVLVALFVVAMDKVQLSTIPAEYSIHWLTAFATIFCAFSLQVFANFVNDYYDYKKGADKKGRVGFRRALAEREVTVRQMRVALIITLLIILLSGFYLVLRGGLPILFVGLLAILFAWLYTATRYSLAYLGIADLFVFLFFGVVATTGTVWLQNSTWDWSAFWAGGVNGVISMCVLCINNLRDYEDDRSVGKRTIPVRFGHKAGYMELIICSLFSFLFAYLAFGFSWPCLIIIPMIYLCIKVLKAQGVEYNNCLVLAGKINMVYVALVALSLFISR